MMKPANAFTTSTQQQHHHQIVSVPSLEHQVKPHLAATDVPFSTYLIPNEPEKRTSSPREYPGSAAADDSELSIFDARKYFNEGGQQDQILSSSNRVSPLKEFNNLNLYDAPSFPRFSSASSVDGYGPGYRTRSLASSEASWNSQTGLLSSNARGANSGPQTGGKRGSRIIPRWLLFRPKCPCSGKKSVRVKERTADNHGITAPKEAANPTMPVEVRAVKVNIIPDSHERFLNSVRQFRPTVENNFPSAGGGRHLVVSAPPKPLIDSSISSSTGFTFPILPAPSMSSSSPPPTVRMPWSGSQSSPASPSPRPVLPILDNRPIDSLEVFKPPSDYLDSGKSLEKRIHHPVLKFPVSLKSQTGTTADEGDELGSDASSDLFEIESISTQATYPITHQRQGDSLDEVCPRASMNENCHMDEKQGQVSGQETAKDYSVTSPEFERSPKN
ncbi:protein PHYTOCHROME KINASE SUBSTRATE 4-like [Punica granatum]|uniref:Protein PHYTOCHROME KINASE SUBSTRATE 4-like n=1 Tax=Punica granatum TaxID=22663 RepID=A0A218X1Z5_PUNGR|nr:protein PHYTOCHROME KINASE SUBSTRATE 4-like [Punica granatum]OWM78858.1 hypothetical protein CDL15_Pgr003029 [Punica granatum]